MKIWTEADHQRNALTGQTIAVIGYGSQGRAHARNLKDSGHDVVIGARRNGGSWKKAADDGFRVAEPTDAAAQAGLIALLTPDMAQAQVYGQIESAIKPGSALLFAHGFKPIAANEYQTSGAVIQTFIETALEKLIPAKQRHPFPQFPTQL